MNQDKFIDNSKGHQKARPKPGIEIVSASLQRAKARFIERRRALGQRLRKGIRHRPLTALGLSIALVLVLAAPISAAALHDSRQGIQEGDHVLYHFHVYHSDGTVLYTTDLSLAENEIARGNAHLVDEGNATPMTYQSRGGFLVRTAGVEFDHVQFFMNHHEGDVVRTPLMKSPFPATQQFDIPRVATNVSLDFHVPIEDLENYLGDSPGDTGDFLYAGFPATATIATNHTAFVQVQVATGDIIHSETLGFSLAAIRVDGDVADLEPELKPGDVFETGQCGLSFGLEPGVYEVLEVNQDNITLRPFSPANAFEIEDVYIEFVILSVDDYPEITALKLRLQQTWNDLSANVSWPF